MRKNQSLLYVFLCMAVFAHGQDAEGCKDNTLLTRMPNFLIAECSENFNAVNFQVGANGKMQMLEGNVSTYRYAFGSETAKMPSPLQIIRNYESAIVSKGGKRIYSGQDDDENGGIQSGIFQMSSGGKEIWVAVKNMDQPGANGEIGAYTLVILSKEAMKQEVQAAELFQTLQAKGSVVVYINFETAKATIKPESLPIIEQIAKMLTDNPGLAVYIDGHTDNEGTGPANQLLSENRAKAVTGMLGEKGIDKGRLAARGFGQTKPIADNSTAEGRAKNRRVEISKK